MARDARRRAGVGWCALRQSCTAGGPPSQWMTAGTLWQKQVLQGMRQLPPFTCSPWGPRCGWILAGWGGGGGKGW